MKPLKTVILGVAVTASGLAPLHDANAWIAAGGFHPGGYYHGAAYFHPAYHGGCYGCGAAAGAVAGLAVGAVAGAAIASASRPATVVVQQPPPVVVQQPAYTQGNLPIGTQVAALPAGSTSLVVNGVHYYQSGPTWYKPYFGSSGVYYEVVPAP